MKFSPTAPTDSLLRAQVEPRLFELYHENSKLFYGLTAASAFSVGTETLAERHLTTRGFRQYQQDAQVELLPAAVSTEPLQDLLLRRRSRRDLSEPLELSDLSTLLTQSLGCTAVVSDSAHNISHALRAWPSAGGLYPLDAFVICAKVRDVPVGVYHFNPIVGRLELLQSRPLTEILADAYFNQDFARDAALAVCLVASFDRTVAKYGERGYRLVLLDAGHAAQNLLLTAEQLQLNAVPMAGYCDDRLSSDLGFDGISESVVHTILCGKAT